MKKLLLHSGCPAPPCPKKRICALAERWPKMAPKKGARASAKGVRASAKSAGVSAVAYTILLMLGAWPVAVVSVLLPALAAISWCALVASIPLSSLPAFAWRRRYPLLARAEASPGRRFGWAEWARPPAASASLDDTLAPFVTSSSALLVRGGYAAPPSFLMDDGALRQYFGERLLTVEARPKGEKVFAFGQVAYRRMTMAAFLAERNGRDAADAEREEKEEMEEKEEQGEEEEEEEEEELYLVQQPLPAADVAPPPWLLHPSTKAQLISWESVNLWMSGSKSGNETSACHLDVADNLHVVLKGRKTVVLMPPSRTRLLRPQQPSDGTGAFESPYCGVSGVELRRLASKPSSEGGGRVVTLNAGDVLFIPRYWWHEVRTEPSAGPSTSLNFWFRNGHQFTEPFTDEMNQLNLDLYFEARAATEGAGWLSAFAEEARRLRGGARGYAERGIEVTGYTHNPADAAPGAPLAGAGAGAAAARPAEEAAEEPIARGCELKRGQAPSLRCAALQAHAVAARALRVGAPRPGCLRLYPAELPAECASRAEQLLPPSLREGYTMGGAVPVLDWWLGAAMAAPDASAAPAAAAAPAAGGHERVASASATWNRSYVEAHVAAFGREAILEQAFRSTLGGWSRANADAVHSGKWDLFGAAGAGAAGASATLAPPPPLLGAEPYAGGALLHVLALEAYPVRGLRVAVVGSASPWIEAILLNHGASTVTTVEYDPPLIEDERIRSRSYGDFANASQVDDPDELGSFDAIFSFSSLEHSVHKDPSRCCDFLKPSLQLILQSSGPRALRRRAGPGRRPQCDGRDRAAAGARRAAVLWRAGRAGRAGTEAYILCCELLK